MRKIFLLIAVGCVFQYCSHKLGSSKTGNTTVTSTSGDTLSKTSVAGNAGPLKAPRRGEVLFLGHNSKHHDAGKYAPWLAISLFRLGVNLTYTTSLNDLNEANLQKYDGLIIYANHDSISASQESALKNFVQGGKGLIPIHSATGCFKNSEWYINTVGGQFKSHGV